MSRLELGLEKGEGQKIRVGASYFHRRQKEGSCEHFTVRLGWTH